MINVYVVPEAAMIDQNVGDRFVISIVSPGRVHPNIIGTNVHKFHFHDVTQVYEVADGQLIRPMSETIADQIAEIAIKNVTVKEWIIHCEAGISRSPGVAIAISKYIKLNPNRKALKKAFPMFNKYVCLLIEQSIEMKIKELEKEFPVLGCDGWEGM